MEHEAWPSAQTPSREPLPRVEDLPVAEQGYEQESVKAAFDSFYRHAAQLDAALRTLEAVDSFHRQAAALRSDLRALRTAGWTQQSWSAPPTYGYGVRAPREGIPPAVWRIGGEVAFLVTVAVVLGVAKLAWWAILLAMAIAFAIVCVIEWLAGREQYSFARAAEPAPPLPVVEAQRIEETDESDASGWTAFEEAQEPSDAMTMVGPPPREESAAEPEAEPEPEQPEEPEPEPEPELPPAAERTPQVEEQERRHWWQRRIEPTQDEAEPAEQPRHVRVLPADEAVAADPWEDGFDASEEPEEETEEPAIVVEEQPRRRFRRR
jgi:outer membrane biosynthesis protein TonB